MHLHEPGLGNAATNDVLQIVVTLKLFRRQIEIWAYPP